MRLVKDAFLRACEESIEAGMESLLSHAHQDCEFRPLAAQQRVLRGPAEMRAYFHEASSGGTAWQVRPQTFREDGDRVIVSGSVRLVRATGGFAESQVRWTYKFRDGRVAAVRTEPRYSG
jgi:ketosteroid isomerase-like protein